MWARTRFCPSSTPTGTEPSNDAAMDEEEEAAREEEEEEERRIPVLCLSPEGVTRVTREARDVRRDDAAPVMTGRWGSQDPAA